MAPVALQLPASLEVTGVSYSADVSWLRLGGGCLSLIFAAMGGHADLEGLDDAGKTWRGCCLGLQRAGALEPWLSDGSFPLPACA